MENISPNISWKEATVSETGKRLGIENTPPDSIVKMMKVTTNKLFEPIRAHFGKPITIISFFRSDRLNKAVGGSKTSQHKLGEAIDVEAGSPSFTNADIFYYLLNGDIEYDQIIWEFGDDKEPDWVHISYTERRMNRRQALKARKVNGKTVYEIFK